MRKRIGEILREKGYATEEQINQALHVQSRSKTHKWLGQILIEQGIITEDQLLETKEILVVDDDRYTRMMLEHIFTQEGYTVWAYPDARQGLENLQIHIPDVIISEVTMTGMDGFEFCQRVRSDPRTADIPFVFLSSRAGVDNRVRGLNLGADDYIEKPFELRELMAKLRVLFRRIEVYRYQQAQLQAEVGLRRDLEQGGDGRTIVLVDDEPFTLKLLRQSLEDAGFRVLAAQSGREGLSLIRTYRPDLILSDVMMPDIDGFELKKQLQRDASLGSIPFVFLTAWDDTEDVLNGLQLGADDYISKTTGPQIVVEKARALLDRNTMAARRTRAELREAVDQIPLYLLPETPPIVEGILLAHRHLPFEGVPGGDYYDYIPIQNDAVAVVIGDVMGKKWRAWFFSLAYLSYLRSVVRTASRIGQSAGQILTEANRLLSEDLKVSEIFNTLFLIIIHEKDKTIEYAGASHPPPIYYEDRTGTCHDLESSGLLLGVMEDGEYASRERAMGVGDLVVLYTDGITEAADPEGGMYGRDRLKDLVKKHHDLPPDLLLDRIYQDVATFRREAPPNDDMTAIVVQRTG